MLSLRHWEYHARANVPNLHFLHVVCEPRHSPEFASETYEIGHMSMENREGKYALNQRHLDALLLLHPAACDGSAVTAYEGCWLFFVVSNDHGLIDLKSVVKFGFQESTNPILNPATKVPRQSAGHHPAGWGCR